MIYVVKLNSPLLVIFEAHRKLGNNLYANHMAQRFQKDEPCKLLEYIKMSQYIRLHNTILFHLNFKTLSSIGILGCNDDRNSTDKYGAQNSLFSDIRLACLSEPHCQFDFLPTT